MKSSFAYKAVFYKGQNIETDFWTGYAIDKQINYGNPDLARGVGGDEVGIGFMTFYFLISELLERQALKDWQLLLKMPEEYDYDIS